MLEWKVVAAGAWQPDRQALDGVKAGGEAWAPAWRGSEATTTDGTSDGVASLDQVVGEGGRMPFPS
jgi:hypothetical protein